MTTKKDRMPDSRLGEAVVSLRRSLEIGHDNSNPYPSALTIPSVIFLASPNSIMVLSRKNSSMRAAKRLGFTFEGIFRNHMVVKGLSRDSAWFSIIDSEWPTLREAYLKWLSPDNFDEGGVQRKPLSDFIQRT